MLSVDTAHNLIERGEGRTSMGKDTYNEPVTIKVGNIIGKVYSPILTDSEYDRRMKEVKKSAIRLVLSKK